MIEARQMHVGLVRASRKTIQERPLLRFAVVQRESFAAAARTPPVVLVSRLTDHSHGLNHSGRAGGYNVAASARTWAAARSRASAAPASVRVGSTRT